MSLKKTEMFEDYLQDIHASNYEGLDDDMPEDYEEWLSNLDVQELIDYADKFVAKVRTELLKRLGDG